MYRIYLHNNNAKELKDLKNIIKSIIYNSEYFRNTKLFCIQDLNKDIKIKTNINFKYWNIYIFDFNIEELYALQKIRALDYCCFIILLINDKNNILSIINSKCSVLDIILKSDIKGTKEQLESCFDIIHIRTETFYKQFLDIQTNYTK